MPVMSGLEATIAIRARERTTGAHVPIVAMTAHAMTGDRERCLAAGMDGYVSKPLRPDELLATVDAVWRRQSRTPLRPARCSRTWRPASARPRQGRDDASHGSLNEATLIAGFRRQSQGPARGDRHVPRRRPCTPGGGSTRPAIRRWTGLAPQRTRSRDRSGLFVQAGAFETARQLERTAKAGDLKSSGPLCATLEAEMRALDVGAARPARTSRLKCVADRALMLKCSRFLVSSASRPAT